jgi:hypothetical protein
MANIALVESFLAALDPDLRRALVETFRYTLSDYRLGGGQKATNFGWFPYTAVTSSVAGTEFSVAHGQGVVPHWLIPVLELTAVGSQLVPLTVTRAPDASRVYLSSASTSATVRFLLEF